MMVLGVLGTAKNTGKTTATLALLQEAARRGLTPGVTSIGYDGEEVDNITGLPKPRVLCPPGVLVATAEACLHAGTARIEVLEELPATTALGRVVLGRVREAGLVVLAGPNLGRGVRRVAGRMDELGCDLVIVDGALNRVVPMAETGGVVLATGAARDVDTRLVAEEAGYIAAVLGLPTAAVPPRVAGPGSLLDEEDGRSAGAAVREVESAGETSGVFLPGVVGERGLAALARSLSAPDRSLSASAPGAEVTIVFSNPMVLLAAGYFREVGRSLREIRAAGVRVACLRSVPLLAVTVNPLYPDSGGGKGPYRYAGVDPEELRLRVARAVRVPVVDVVRDGSARLFDDCSGGGIPGWLWTTRSTESSN